MRVFVVTKRTLVLLVIALVCIAAAIVLSIVLGGGGKDSTVGAAPLEQYEVTVLAGKKKELPVYSVAREDKKIALTIDAAWEDDKTPFILEELDRQGIKATFYLCGFWAEKYPENVKAIAEAGHELGNHTATHPHMNELSAEQIQRELTAFDDMLEQITGVRSKTFRAPYGEYNDLVITTS
ncbi:MAG: polysaccharide deacetylase family protein, partial [Clostridia bacterium]|nr:polysaccharide deacetylase family protein [Clostridia bacterium]